MLRIIKSAAAAALLSLSLAPSAMAEPVDVSTLTCKELVGAIEANNAAEAKAKKTSTKPSEGDESRAQLFGVLMTWLHGYHATGDNASMFDQPSLEAYFEKLGEYCFKNQKVGLMSAAARFSGKNAPKPAKTAVDATTVRCDTIKADAISDEQAAMLIWLGGRQAAASKDTMFDLEAFTERIGHVAVYCSKNPSRGLTTAVRSVFKE